MAALKRMDDDEGDYVVTLSDASEDDVRSAINGAARERRRRRRR